MIVKHRKRKLLFAEDVAEIIGYSVRSATDLMTNNAIPSFEHEGKLCTRKKYVIQWADELIERKTTLLKKARRG